MHLGHRYVFCQNLGIVFPSLGYTTRSAAELEADLSAQSLEIDCWRCNGAASHGRRRPWFARAWDAVQEPPLSSVAHLRVSTRAAKEQTNCLLGLYLDAIRLVIR